MEDVQNIGHSSRMAVVDEVFPGGKASHAGGDTLKWPSAKLKFLPDGIKECAKLDAFV